MLGWLAGVWGLTMRLPGFQSIRYPREMRVTTAMLQAADQIADSGGVPSPFKRIGIPSQHQRTVYERAHGGAMPAHFVSEDIALTIKCYPPAGDFEWLTWRTIVRPGLDFEIEAQCRLHPGFAWLVATAESAEDSERKQMAARLDAAHVEAARRASTAVCGAPMGGTCAPCSDADEVRCEWFTRAPAAESSLKVRTLARPVECPRRMAHEAKAAELAVLRSQAGAERLIPQALTDTITLKRPESSPALEAVRAWYRSGRKMLALCGPAGCGKSLAAAAWLLSIDKGSPLWVSGSILKIETLPHAEKEVLRRAVGASALVIDGVAPDDKRGPVIDLLLGAVRNGCSAILTTTMTEGQWSRFLSPDPSDLSPTAKRWDLYGQTIQLKAWHRRALAVTP